MEEALCSVIWCSAVDGYAERDNRDAFTRVVYREAAAASASAAVVAVAVAAVTTGGEERKKKARRARSSALARSAPLRSSSQGGKAEKRQAAPIIAPLVARTGSSPSSRLAYARGRAPHMQADVHAYTVTHSFTRARSLARSFSRPAAPVPSILSARSLSSLPFPAPALRVFYFAPHGDDGGGGGGDDDDYDDDGGGGGDCAT